MKTALDKPIAVTGGIATGKSTVCQIIAEYGFSVGSADEIAHEVFERRDVQMHISGMFEVPIPLDRAKIREKISESVDLRRKFNQYIHPLVLFELDRTCHSFVEVPLALETCILDHFSQIWVAWCDPQTQRERILLQIEDEYAAERWIRTQIPINAKVAFADAIIRTNCDLASVREHIARLVRAVCAKEVASD